MSCITLAVNSTPVNKQTLDKVDITPSYLGGCTNTALLANFTTGFVHIYWDASNRLQRSYFPRIAGYIRGTVRVPIRADIPEPILLLLFVDNLPNAVKTSRVACYADDTKIFKSIDSIKDCSALQSDLNDLVCWSDSSVLIFNQSKCKHQCITPQKTPLRPTSGYTINETPLESCDTEKDLGVWVSRNLTSDKQCSSS